MKFLSLLTLLLIYSCTSVKENKRLAWESWKGRTTEELAKHPYFKQLPVTKIQHKDGMETWILRDQTKFQTDAYCQSLGGCIGIPIYNCNNAFSVKAGIILGFEQSGSCPGPKTIQAPEP